MKKLAMKKLSMQKKKNREKTKKVFTTRAQIRSFKDVLCFDFGIWIFLLCVV